MTHSGLSIRPAIDSDLDEILAIHNAAIRDSLAIWTEIEVDRADRERWLAAHEVVGHPVIVAEIDGAVAGYAAYGPWREKSGYRHTVENSVYVAEGFQRQGIARLLMVDLIELARENGIHVMIAAIEAGNLASIALHEQLGFEPPQIMREVGIKFDRWLDLAFMRLQL
ncbi:MAG: GNAT family N-acetyltransferase [Actinobacteria bacterium]|nr:GNAT family N-acetyltransferase [Actinomycetota bacterium]